VQVSCGHNHSAFITTQYLCYTMGANNKGQLGINEPYTDAKYSPVLVRGLLEAQPLKVSCGNEHTLV
jgi:alpha-tubulin suppressor-like RCC1 family protein